MRIEWSPKLDFNNVLIKPKRSVITSRSEVELARTFTFRHARVQSWVGVPIISSNMTTVTTPQVARAMGLHYMLACMPKDSDLSSFEGISDEVIVQSRGMKPPARTNGRFLCLDVANGYMEKFVKLVDSSRRFYSDKIIIAGNVVSPEMTEALILAGADIVKVGLGSGSACATRIKTGVGYPQLSAIIECADAAHGLNGHIISDGGCSTPGDIAKAFAAGADFVMLGGMLAGHDENGTDFYGMSSKKANEIHAGGLKTYRASEGLELTIPSRGSIEATLQEIEGGLRSACSYCGAKRLKDLPKCATFVLVNQISNSYLKEYTRAT
jgi:GMP reductase